MNKETLLALHNRLLGGDPTASAEIAEQVLEPLIESFKHGFTHVEHALVTNAAEDAILSYLKHPTKFDPSKRSLFGYLKMSARGDLLNALDAQKRCREREKTTENVEELLDKRNRYSKKAAPDIGAQIDSEEIWQKVQASFPDPVDKRLLDLIQNGVKATEGYAEVLGIENLPVEKQRKTVKRHKDRILKRLARLRSTIHE